MQLNGALEETSDETDFLEIVFDPWLISFEPFNPFMNLQICKLSRILSRYFRYVNSKEFLVQNRHGIDFCLMSVSVEKIEIHYFIR